jgi:hypothetical protein
LEMLLEQLTLLVISIDITRTKIYRDTSILLSTSMDRKGYL